MIGRALLGTLVAIAAAAAPAQTQAKQQTETAVTVASPTYSTTITDEQVEHWTNAVKLASDGGGPKAHRRQALDLLIKIAWTDGEAIERGVTVTREQAKESVDEDVGESFKSEAEFRRFLKAVGQTKQDMITTTRTDMLTTAILDQIKEAAAKSVTPEQIDAYVQANPQQIPELRKVRFIGAGSRPAAKRAYRALQNGLTWKTAIKRFSKDSFFKTKRTYETGVYPERVDRAVYAAKKGVLTRYGPIVFKVTDITPARALPPEQQKARAWEVLSSEAQANAVQQFETEFRAKWRARTTCATAYETHEDCGNPPSGE